MNHFATTVLSLALSVSVAAQAIPGKRKPARAVRPEVQACRDRITELVSLSDHFDALTPEKLTSVQKEVNDCVYAESAGLSKDDIIAAYKLRDGTGREVVRRIREAAEKTIADDNTLREAARKIALGFLDEDKGYKDLVQRYNTLVGSYNGMLREYRATVEQNGLFLDRMQESVQAANYNCQVNALQNLINSAARTKPQVVYKPLPSFTAPPRTCQRQLRGCRRGLIPTATERDRGYEQAWFPRKAAWISARAVLALSQVAGKRLTFAELTGKNGEIPF